MTDSSNSFIFQGTKQPWLIFFVFFLLYSFQAICAQFYTYIVLLTMDQSYHGGFWPFTKIAPKMHCPLLLEAGGWCFYRTTSKITKIGCPRFCTTHLLFPSELSLQHDHYSWLAKLCQRGVFLFIFLRALKNSQNSSNKKGLLSLYKNCFCYICMF